MRYKVIVAHPAKQHSFQMATALNKKHVLYKYCTTIYDRKGSLVYALKKCVLRGKDFKKASSRRCGELDDRQVIQFNEVGALFAIFLQRLAIKYPVFLFQRFAMYWESFNASCFYKKVMRYALKKNVDAIVVYDALDNKHLKMLEGSGITKIIDMSIAHKTTLRRDFEKEASYYSMSEFKKEHFYYWDSKLYSRYQSNILLGDHFIVASNYVRNSLLSAGIANNKISLIPYGVDINSFVPKYKKSASHSVFKLVYVGGVVPRKGIYRLIDVVKSFPPDSIELDIAGAYSKKSMTYRMAQGADNIHFHGFVTRDQLNDFYNNSDVFVFPTLGEGFGMVVLEALAAGLPVICSNRAGGNDIIIDGYNGYVYDPINNDNLKNIISYLMNNREVTEKMRINARHTAEHYSWDFYHDTVGETIKRVIHDSSKRCD